MSRTVGDKADQFFIFPLFPWNSLVEEFADFFHYLKIVALVVTTNVVSLSALSFVEDEVDGLAVVQHIQPVPHVAAGAIDGYRLSVQAFPDDGGDEFLGMLLGAVVVGAVAGGDVHPVGMVVCPDDMVGGGFAGTVGAVGGIRGFFGEVACFTQGAIDFVGADVVEPCCFITGFRLAGRFHPVFPCGLDEGEGANDIGLDEGLRPFDGVVDMAFCSKVDDALDIMLAEEAIYQCFITDVALDEGVVGHAFAFPEVVKVPCIGEFVKVDDVVGRVFLGEVRDEIGPDEPGAAGDEDAFH